MKMDDLLIFATLEKLKKCCSLDGCLRRAKKLNAVYGLNWANFILFLTFKFNFHRFLEEYSSVQEPGLT